MNEPKITGTASKFMRPVLDARDEYRGMNETEKIEAIKDAYGLHHGKGKSRRKKSKK